RSRRQNGPPLPHHRLKAVQSKIQDLKSKNPMPPPPALASAAALAWREILRFFRQRNRIVGSLGTPLVFWLLFGVGISGSYRVRTDFGEQLQSDQSFLTYYFPSTLLLMVLFSAIFSSTSIIEDRR